MAKCGCNSSCTCLVASSDSLIISGDGNDAGYRGTLRVDPASPIPITISSAGISIAGVGAGTGYAVNITSVPRADIAATNVQAALDELDDDKQPRSPMLTALSTYTVNGLMAKTAPNTFTGRSIVGTVNRINVTNGDGILGNPTLTIPNKLGITDLLDGDGQEVLSLTQGVPSAVNRILLTNSSTGVSPIVSVTGSNANIDLVLSAKGNGIIRSKKATVTEVVTLIDDTIINTNASLSNHFRVTLSGNRTLANPTNPTDGQKVIWEIRQDATGSRTISYGSQFAFGTDVTSAVLSTTPNKIDFVGAIYVASSSKWYVTALTRGY